MWPLWLAVAHERLDSLDPHAIALREADEDAPLALELLARVHEDDPGEAAAPVEAEVVRLGGLLAPTGLRTSDRRVEHVARRVVGDVRERVAARPEAHGPRLDD